MPLRIAPVPLRDVTILEGFWFGRLTVNRRTTVPAEYRQMLRTGHIRAWRFRRPQRRETPTHIFWDSDLAKWMEAAAYSLATHPDRRLERRLDAIIESMARRQWPDGYLNSHFIQTGIDRRWTNLRDCHELYCAGHLMEAAVAHFQATGKRTFLDVMCRCADHIGQTFGRGRRQHRGYPGHPEIELALVKLHRATGRKEYLDLAEYFIEERGRRPNYFDLEACRRGEAPDTRVGGDYRYLQAHRPVRRQTAIDGHAVRAPYLCCGMVDVAAATDDRDLMATCRRLWRSALRRMYVTGGVGSDRNGERFTFDADLPNETAYAETCASIALFLFAHRLLHVDVDGRYADVMERTLYNGILSGVSVDGRRFRYANPLTVYPPAANELGENYTPRRRPWFGCACCPPNIARLLASLGQYVYSQGRGAVFVHLYIGGAVELLLGKRRVRLVQQTRYPWDGGVRMSIHLDRPTRFSLALRIPEWCRGASVRVNGRPVGIQDKLWREYVRLSRRWQDGDVVELLLPMPVERIYADPSVRADAGKVALRRGPIIYCIEQADNGPDLAAISLPRSARLRAVFDRRFLGGRMGGTVILRGKALRDVRPAGPAARSDALYGTAPPRRRAATIQAVPYCLWGNRRVGEMMVWLRET